MDDPHIHVGSDLNLDGAVRNVVASTFGVAGDLPSVVATGCGLRVPRANTSRLPERVTCLPCREYAHRRFLNYADQYLTHGMTRITGTRQACEQPPRTYTKGTTTRSV